MNSDKEIRDLFAKYSVPLDRDDVWEVQKARVVKHKALERLSAAMKIKWAAPQILRSEADEAVILATGETENASEWSIGEARVVPMVDTGRKNQWGKPIYEPADGSIGNYQITPKQAAYVYAMAEKRAKDRVIIKLAGLHGVYSEDEADDFKNNAPAGPTAAETYVAQCRDIIAACANTQVLKDWWAKEADMRGHLFAGKDDPDFQDLWKAFIARGDELAKQQKEAA